MKNIYFLKKSFLVAFFSFITCAASLFAQSCPDNFAQTQSNGQATACPGVNGNPVYAGLVAPFNAIPAGAKTGNLTLKFTADPGVPMAIKNAYSQLGVLLPQSFGPPSPYDAATGQIKYCIYGTGNLGSKYVLEMVNGANGNLVSRCTYNGVGAAVASPTVVYNSNGSACLNTTKEIQVTASGYTGALTYTWQVSTDGGVLFSTIVANSTYSMVNTTPTSKLIIAGASVTSGLNGYQYRCIVDDASGGATITNGLTLQTNDLYTWLGGISTAWNTADNWSCSTIPPANANVTIINTPPFSPQIPAGTTTVNNLIFGTGSSVDLNTGTLVINGVITNNPIFKGNSLGSLTMNGANTKTINFTGIANAKFANLTINNSSASYTLSGNVDIHRSMNVTNGTLSAGSDTITLKSISITNTAVAGPVGGTISGRIRVERFIPASNRAFRFISPGVTTTTTILANWQEGVNNTTTVNYPTAAGTSTNFFDRYGTHITGSKTGANGFDATVSGNPSTYTFNKTTQAWAAIPNTNATTLNATVPYLVSVRGSRSTDLNTNTPAITSTVLRATGSLTTGPVTYSTILAQGTDEFSFVANPYWAPVDWEGLSRTNIGTSYWIWDPTLAGSNGKGQYVSCTIGSGSSGGGQMNELIQPGQAFFIKNTAPNPSLSFVESNKRVNGTLTATFRTQYTITGKFVTKLYLKSNFSQELMADAATIVLCNSFNKSIGDEDAEKWNNGDESVSFLVNNTSLGLTGIPVPANRDTVFMQLKNLKSMNYVLQITGKDFLPNSDNISAFLIDNYLNTVVNINNYGNKDYEFNIDNNPASASEGRFSIVITSANPLPVTITNIKAIAKNNGAEVEWTVENEINMDSYVVEHSADGTHFTAIGNRKAEGVSLKTYSMMHNTPVTGANYYRVQSKGKSGDIQYTKVVKLNFGKTASVVSVFPNPVKGKIINLQFTGDKGIYTVILTNTAGQELYKKDINHIGGSANQTITLSNHFSAGNYRLQLIGNGVSEVLQVVKQ